MLAVAMACRHLIAALILTAGALAQPVLPDTAALEGESDLAVEMVEGIHRYLDRATQQAAANRESFWDRDYGSEVAYERSVEPNRKGLSRILGVVDARVPIEALEFVAHRGLGLAEGGAEGGQLFGWGCGIWCRGARCGGRRAVWVGLRVLEALVLPSVMAGLVGPP